VNKVTFCKCANGNNYPQYSSIAAISFSITETMICIQRIKKRQWKTL